VLGHFQYKLVEIKSRFIISEARKSLKLL